MGVGSPVRGRVAAVSLLDARDASSQSCASGLICLCFFFCPELGLISPYRWSRGAPRRGTAASQLIFNRSSLFLLRFVASRMHLRCCAKPSYQAQQGINCEKGEPHENWRPAYFEEERSHLASIRPRISKPVSLPGVINFITQRNCRDPLGFVRSILGSRKTRGSYFGLTKDV